MTKRVYLWIGVGIVVIVGSVFLLQQSGTPGRLDSFATCLKDKGAVFYGAWWCPHCQNQKKMFGKSAKLLPYVECSPANRQGQFPICIEKKIDGYPIWDYPDGSRESGEIPLARLAEKTGCKLPE